jgi:hypothetical protein
MKMELCDAAPVIPLTTGRTEIAVISYVAIGKQQDGINATPIFNVRFAIASAAENNISMDCILTNDMEKEPHNNCRIYQGFAVAK